MKLNDLIDIDLKPEHTGIDIVAMSADSREIKSGFLFAAFPGTKTDGRDYIEQAITQGAAAILTRDYTGDVPAHIPIINVDHPRQYFAKMAARLYALQPKVIVAVTGSNGKTSTVNFCRQLWQKMGHTAASLGTIGIDAPGLIHTAGMTTPDPVTLHAELCELERCGISHLAMEASSHGLDQYRLDGVRLKAAGFTNLSRDHLDYHGTMERYLEAKMRLFTEVLEPDGTAVLNADVPEFAKLQAACLDRGINIISYGRRPSDIRILKRDILPEGQDLILKVLGEEFDVTLPLVGEFQTYNALCALGLVIGADAGENLRPFEAVTYLEKLEGVRGRMQRVGMLKNGAAVYVDYAHTPDGLQTVLTSLRPHTQNKLHVVFGCGGDRDRGKRPMMGEIAAKLADRAIVTDDNPRSEKPDAIRREVMDGIDGLIEIGGRQKAIETAITGLEKGDILVIAGKGHEQGQIIGDQVLPFDDAKVAQEIIGDIE